MMPNNMSTLKERLEEALKDSKITKTAIWKACGLSSGAVSQWFSGSTQKIEGENLLNAAKALKVNPEWLATGKGKKRNDNIQLEDKPIAQFENVIGFEDASNRLNKKQLVMMETILSTFVILPEKYQQQIYDQMDQLYRLSMLENKNIKEIVHNNINEKEIGISNVKRERSRTRT